MDGFLFTNTAYVDDGDSVIVRIPANLEQVEDLFIVFEQQLGLPEYFGKNWDALSDSLRDLSWVSKHTVVLIHRGRTFIDDALWIVYLDVLRECIENWEKDEEHSIVAVFPESCRDEVGRLTRVEKRAASGGSG